MSASNLIDVPLGDVIRKYRTFQGLTLGDLGEMCRLHEIYLGQIERGKINPGIKNLRKIACALGVTTAHLTGEVPFLSEWPQGE